MLLFRVYKETRDALDDLNSLLYWRLLEETLVPRPII